jgi:hypothetical protein
MGSAGESAIAVDVTASGECGELRRNWSISEAGLDVGERCGSSCATLRDLRLAFDVAEFPFEMAASGSLMYGILAALYSADVA